MERGVSEPLETEEEINRLHNEKMARRKAVRERMLAAKTEERGLLIVHTGKGKGKSTAAFGLVLRCLGHGMRVRIVQFVKGVWQTGERMALERFGDLVTCRAMGEGFTWDTQDRARFPVYARVPSCRSLGPPRRISNLDTMGCPVWILCGVEKGVVRAAGILGSATMAAGFEPPIPLAKEPRSRSLITRNSLTPHPSAFHQTPHRSDPLRHRRVARSRQ
jgi:hypothetical protein